MQQQQQQRQNVIVPVEERDYLVEDPPIRGQNFACVSFLCPQEVLRQKHAFMLQEFVKGLGADVAALFESLEAKYGGNSEVEETMRSLRERYAYLWSEDEMKEQFAQFNVMRGDELGEQFDESNKFQTSTMGVKIRGVFDSIDKANQKAKDLHEDVDQQKGNVFVAEVGRWAPWNPDPSKIENNQYAVNELNTLMKHYDENRMKKDEVYKERVRQRRELLVNSNQNRKENGNGTEGEKVDVQVDEEGRDAYETWLNKQRKGLASGRRPKQAPSDGRGGGPSSSSASASASGSDGTSISKAVRQKAAQNKSNKQ